MSAERSAGRRRLAVTESMIAVLAAGALASGARAEPANTLAEMGAMIAACSRVQGGPPGSGGSFLRVMFSLKRDGSLLGPPMITYADLRGDEAVRSAFRDAALKSFTGCFPIAITDGLGGAVAGRRRQTVLR